METFGIILLVVQISLMITSNATPWGVNSGIDVPEECKGQGFCTVRPPGYDKIEEELNHILPKQMIDFHARSSEPTNFRPEDDDDNCPTIVTSKSVYLYDNNDEEPDIIVQTKFIPQIVTQVNCAWSRMENGQECFKNLGLSPFGMKSSCREHSATRSLLVYDTRVKKVAIKNYTIPVCCSCHVTN